MAVYNGEQYVDKAIKSIINQTYQNIEFIIIDDSSNDNSFKIIKKWADNEKKIKILKNSINIGLTKSLNKAIKICQGDFIARQDADDVSLPSRLEKQVDFLKKNKYFAFCGCDSIRKQNKNQNLIYYFDYNEIEKNLIVENCFIHPSILIRTSILKTYGAYDESYYYGQDYELWCRLIYKYKLKAKNLHDKLIIMNIPSKKFYKKYLKKFLTQRINTVKTQFKYIKFTQYKFKAVISVFIRLLEIISLSHVIGFFIELLKKFNR